MSQVNPSYGICMLPRCGWSKKPNLRRNQSPRNPFTNDLRPSIFVVLAATAAPGGMATGKTGPAAGVCLFIDATRSGNSEYNQGAHRRIFDITSLAYAGALHHCASATEINEKRNESDGEWRGYCGRD